MDFAQFKTRFGFDNLNRQQETAVQRWDGATLLLATPGSGKTTVIVARTGYMLYVTGIPARNILTLTYTRAAAEEMKTRFIKRFSTTPANTPNFSTINSFCLSVIRTCQREKGIFLPTLLPYNEVLIRKAAVEMSPEYPSDTTVKLLAQKVGKAKNELMTSAQMAAIDDFDFEFPIFFAKYQEMLRQAGQMDFDDQLLMAYDLLQTYPDILARAQRTFRYISLDEAQDTSLVQHKIVQLLVGRTGNIFMVGDEDQSIYGFRGAYPAALLNFAKDYDNAQILYMETNYRSDRYIVDAANLFIKRNELRNDKNMKAFSSDQGKIMVRKFPSIQEQHQYCLSQISDYLNRPNESLAILARNNDSLAYLQDYMRKLEIDINTKDSAKVFLGDAVVTDMLSFLRFSMEPGNAELFRRLYYKLGLFISKTMAEEAIASGSPDLILAMGQACEQRRLRQQIFCVADTMKALRGESVTPGMALTAILYRGGYYSYLERKFDNGMSERSSMYKINTLRLMANNYSTIPEFLTAMEELLKAPPATGTNITLSTIHSSKGLEFDHVIMVDVLNDVLPSTAPDATKDEIEEEARLFYVGATRARHTLELVSTNKCVDLDLEDSPFLDLYKHFVEDPEKTTQNYQRQIIAARNAKQNIVAKNASVLAAGQGPAVGDRVCHTIFGKGSIVQISASGILLIQFDNCKGSLKKFLKDAYISGTIRKISA